MTRSDETDPNAAGPRWAGLPGNEPDGDDACPLCGSRGLRERARAFGRRYRECPRCRLLSMHPADHPSADAEAVRYRRHRNDRDDTGYRAFLQRLLDPTLAQLRPGDRGLDYGCGPEPLLAALTRAAGHECDAYDPLFHPNAFRPPYDFVLASEVFEHFRDPSAEIPRVLALLDPGEAEREGGLLALMTLCRREDVDLSRWHYLSDPTHVSIYRAETLAWMAQRHRLRRVWADGERVWLGRRRKTEPPRDTLRRRHAVA